MPIKTTNWEINKPITGEQDLAENVADAYDLLDGALLTKDEKKVTKGDYNVTQAGLVINDEEWDSTSGTYKATKVNAMHKHALPKYVRKATDADHANASAKVDHTLNLKTFERASVQTTTQNYNGSGDISYSAANKQHYHPISDIDDLPHFFSGTTTPTSTNPAGAIEGDYYVRFVE